MKRAKWAGNGQRMLALSAALLLCLLASACGKGEGGLPSGENDSAWTETTRTAGASVSQNEEIVIGVAVDFTTMDPADTIDTLSGGIQRMIMDGLFGFDDKMELMPMLATEYSANANATQYELKLREGIRFSDGSPWNARAAKANLDRLTDETLGLRRTTLLAGLVEQVDAADEYTLRIRLTKPFGAFINTLAHPACVMMSPKQIEAGVEACAKEAVGTGQYIFKEWRKGEGLTVALNPDWWGYDAEISGGEALVDPDAGFKSVTFQPVTEGARRVSLLQSGELRAIWPVPSESYDVLVNDDSLSTQSLEGIVVRYLFMNTAKEPFDDPRVRRAVNYAIDKEMYVDVAWDGLATVATSIIAPQVQFYQENSPYPLNVEKAKALLAEAGYPEGFKSKLMCANTTANVKQAEFLREQLAQIGVVVEIQSMENALFNERTQDAGSEAEVEMTISGWSPSTADADWGIRPIVGAGSFPPNGHNLSYYDNQRVDALLEEGLATADPARRAAAYEAVQELIWADSPVVCLANDALTWSNSASVTDFRLFPDGALNMRNAKMYEQDTSKTRARYE